MSWFDKWRRKTVEDAIDDAASVIETKVKEVKESVDIDILPVLATAIPIALIAFGVANKTSGMSEAIPGALHMKIDNVNLYYF